jgi:hypothetical protein
MEIGLAADGYAFPDATTEFFESAASTDIAGMSTPVRPPPELGQGDAICLLAVNGVQEKAPPLRGQVREELLTRTRRNYAEYLRLREL